MGDETKIDRQYLATWITENIDFNLLLQIAETRNSQPVTGNPQLASRKPKIRLGVARDEAFCFYYEDNLDIFRSSGAEIITFSPLHDQSLPAGLNGLYLGGGYPELFAEKLSANHEMRDDIKAFSEARFPVYAECGGFMYLTERIVDLKGTVFKMAGVFPVTARMKQRLSRLGYRQAELQQSTFFGETGALLCGHEFHYSDIDSMPEEVPRAYRLDDGRKEGYLINNTLGSYLHLHFGGTPEAIHTFIEKSQ
jgi:cobyrinic acid a,c-diamide synthase